jgi:hypothetical protein
VVKRALSAGFAALLAIAVFGGCGAILGLDGLKDRADGGASAEDGGDGPVNPNPDAIGATVASKVDVLVVVDNSASMGDKAALLATSIATLLRRITAVVADVHVGVIATSLGSMGGDVCTGGGPSQNTLAHLSTVGAGGGNVLGTTKGFLEYGGGGTSSVDALITGTESLIGGIGQTGCGLEAQLESTYRFLIQPDPWASVVVKANVAQYEGIDNVLLQQRKAFLRPDSFVVVVLLTDEDDSSVDPRSLGGQGWAFENNTFPGSTVFRQDGKTTTAPRANSACSAPTSPDCVSCGCKSSDPACVKNKTDVECMKNGGFYGPTEDQLNVRFFHMKERFGVDPQYPITRYVDGLTKSKVPDRDAEHDLLDGVISPYRGKPTCTNPLFASSLPDPGGDLCNLSKGPRGKELVVFALIGGVPDKLVATGTPDWTKVLGNDPDVYDRAGIDPHMIQSTRPRAGLPPASAERGENGSDPVHGREWDTADDDLQFACTFPLIPARTCTQSDPSCDCAGSKNPPLCAASLGEQVAGKAYPTIRELRVAKALGERGVAGSICPASAAAGYAPTMTVLADRIAPHLVK